MQIHHDNHHAAYINNLNNHVDKWPDMATKPIDDILSNLSAVPEAVRTPVRNNLGGHWNHTFFWELMTPGGAKAPAGDLKSAIDGAFGDFDKMKAARQAGRRSAASARAGHGSRSARTRSSRSSTRANQDTPHMDKAPRPVIGIDVWEHAYYLKHQYQRGRLHRCLVERRELGQGRRQLQEGHGLKPTGRARLLSSTSALEDPASRALPAPIAFETRCE